MSDENKRGTYLDNSTKNIPGEKKSQIKSTEYTTHVSLLRGFKMHSLPVNVGPSVNSELSFSLSNLPKSIQINKHEYVYAIS